ncbi:MAG: hypothetical protein ACYSU1_00490 [Planctomycetota bacterium]
MTEEKPQRIPVVAVLLLLVGLLQMTGDLLQVPAMKGIGAATLLSPAPKVFSSVKGLETYSTRVVLRWKDPAGDPHEVHFDQETYARLEGPYNRRNVYGAALAYGPVLAQDEHLRPLLREVLAYALTGKAPLLQELGIDPASVTYPMSLEFQPLSGTDMGSLPRSLEVPLP